MTYRKKLIEVALPLQSINEACKPETENPFLRGHPRATHVYWARTPLVACRAVIFASLVDDPSARPDLFPDETTQERERRRLFDIVERLAKWESTSDERVLSEARAEIRRSIGESPPPFMDPFCGRASIPLEAQRLGLEVFASDLNPLAVLIAKALVEFPSSLHGIPPVNPDARAKLAHSGGWTGVQGLREDIQHYGRWIRDEAERRIGVMYATGEGHHPPAGQPKVFAWLWARLVRCPNPACSANTPMVRSFLLCDRRGKRTWIHPVTDVAAKTVQFEVRNGEGSPIEGTKQRGRSRCLFCPTDNITDQTLREQATKFGLKHQLMAVVVEGTGGKTYLGPVDISMKEFKPPETPWLDPPLPTNARWFSPPLYGLTTYRDLFTARQLHALALFGDLVGDVRGVIKVDAVNAGLRDDVDESATGRATASAYADAVATYLGLAVSRLTDYHSALCTWNKENENVRNVFDRQAIDMAWDFAEANPFGGYLGPEVAARWVAEGLQAVPEIARAGSAQQLDATQALPLSEGAIVSTDPPYYDNIGYADLTDYFYVWLRRALEAIHPNLFSTLLTPKGPELVASPYRFDGDANAAKEHFEKGMSFAWDHIRSAQHPDFPATVFYAYKQAEEIALGNGASASTGWETMLDGLLKANLSVTGTWPMRTTKKARSVARGTNALASAIVLVCRPRAENAPLATRRDFIVTLREELPGALKTLQHESIAPVDLAQAAIGPGMAVFSRYSKVLEGDGRPMSVRTALSLINQVLDELLTEQESEYDPATRWAIAWFEQFGLDSGEFGDAETLSKAKNVAVRGLVQEGFVLSRGGKVRLLARTELDPDWNLATDTRISVWEVTQHLIQTLESEGESGAAVLLRKLGGLGTSARDLAYRLFTTCERKRWTQEALAYNSLVVAWPEISRLAIEPTQEPQPTLEV